MTFQASRRTYTFDASWQFKDAALVAASAAAQVGGVDKIINLNGDTFIQGVMQIDISAIEVDTNDEVYGLRVEGSNSATFASGIQSLAEIRLGSAGGLGTNCLLSTVGKYELPFMNVQNGVSYQYLRMYSKIAGTIATGINYTAFAGILYAC